MDDLSDLEQRLEKLARAVADVRDGL